jgi:hypothetical protein
MNIADTASVGVHPIPHVISGPLSPDDQSAVFEWVSLNAAALVAYWKAGSTRSSWANCWDGCRRDNPAFRLHHNPRAAVT